MSRARVQVASHGTSRPRAEESSEIGRASNRRVEVKILALAPSKDTTGRGA
jgi:outer membrane protein OmpA-like peptidoglycan-associated protein